MSIVAAELRKSMPGKASRADHGTSLRAAVDLKCMECAGGSRAEVAACPVYHCFLWPHRPAQDDRTRPAGTTPTEEEYAAMVAAKTTDAQREARTASAERLRTMHVAASGILPMTQEEMASAFDAQQWPVQCDVEKNPDGSVTFRPKL